MRVVVWNMSHWLRSEEQRQLGWSVLREELKADVALLQETVPPEPYADQAVYRPIGGTRPWGSAVVGITVDVTKVEDAKGRVNSGPRSILVTQPGTVAVASAEVNGSPLTFISIYGLIEDGYADTTVNRQLSDLAPLFDDPRHEGRIVLGGDLNITTQWAGGQAHYALWEAATFERIRAFGLVDCLDVHREDGPLEDCGCEHGDRCRHIQTQVHASSSRPWQNDYLFASAELTRDVLAKAWVHVDSEAVRALGDHFPLVADLDL